MSRLSGGSKLDAFRVFGQILPAAGLAFALAIIGNARSAQAQVTVESLTSSAVSEVGPYYQDVEEAIQHFLARDFDGARSRLELAKRKTPKLAPPEDMMAQLFIAAGQGPAARAEFERAIKKFPDDPEAYLVLADIAFNEGRITEAALLFSKASTLAANFNENPKRKKNFQMRAAAGLAAVDEARENWAAAKDNLKAWLALDSNNAVAHQRLGRTLFQLGDKREAYEEFKAAVKADPKLPPAELNMALVYAQPGDKGDKTQAEKFITAAAKTGAKDLTTQLALVQWYLQNGQLSEAQKYADEAIKIDGNSMDAKVRRGLIARLQKDYTAAKKYFESAHTQAPGNAAATNQLALALVEQKDEVDQRRALEFAEINQKLNPQNIEAAATLGWVAYRLGRKDIAQRALGAVTNTGQLAPESAYYVAYVLKDQGNTENAIKLLEGALESKTPFPYRQEAETLLADLKKNQKDKPDSSDKSKDKEKSK